MGCGGAGARMTSRIFCGGWLYPDAFSLGAGAEGAFAEDDVDCALIGARAAQIMSTPIKRRPTAFRIRMNSLRMDSPAEANLTQAD
jgi:hypothetical protein